MVGEWNVIEDGAVVVAIKCTPSSIPVLHADHPGGSAFDSFCEPIRVGKTNPIERHQHECRVINVGIEVVAELKRPAARSRIVILNLAVPGPGNLFVQ